MNDSDHHTKSQICFLSVLWLWNMWTASRFVSSKNNNSKYSKHGWVLVWRTESEGGGDLGFSKCDIYKINIMIRKMLSQTNKNLPWVRNMLESFLSPLTKKLSVPNSQDKSIKILYIKALYIHRKSSYNSTIIIITTRIMITI